MRKFFSATSCALAAALLAVSCRSTQIAYQFSPSPLEVLVSQGDDLPNLARVLVSVPGAEREGRSQSGRPELIVRVRIENESTREIRFDPSRSSVLGSDLAEFGAAKVVPSGVRRVAGGKTAIVLLHYPFPQNGSLEAPLLTGLNVRMELDIADGLNGFDSVELSGSLDRVDYYAAGQYNSRNSVNWGLGYRGSYGAGYGGLGYRGGGFGGFGGWGGWGNSYYGCW